MPPNREPGIPPRLLPAVVFVDEAFPGVMLKRFPPVAPLEFPNQFCSVMTVIANELFDLVASPKSMSESAMPPRTCVLCDKARAILKRPKTGQQICRECFFYVFETEVHNTITQSNLFKAGDRVAIGASGGKGAETVIFFITMGLKESQIQQC
jgi:hypothetical protein